MQTGFACVGQSVGRIEDVLPVAEISRRTVGEFSAVLRGLASVHLRS
jgi:hypothetical protein